MSPPIRKKLQIAAVLLLTVSIAVALVLSRRSARHSDLPASGPSTFRQPSEKPGVQSPPTLPSTALDEALEAIRRANEPADILSALQRLKSQLQSTPLPVASEWIRKILDSRLDRGFPLEFRIGPDGFLTQAPSLRVLLLDGLARIDPIAAASYARTVLASMDSPDEWAIALRNCAKGNSSPESRSFLEQKLQSLLNYEPWMQQPSAGFLESFDVAVYLGGTNLIPALTDLVRLHDNQAVSHAAYLALDRMTVADATTTLAFLAANPDLMRGREATRANYFARADVREPAQRQLLEAYLLSPAMDPTELDKFASLYPNANYMVSPNLLTRADTPDGAWLAGRDAEALRIVQQWLADPRFARLQPQLEIIRRRLEAFAQQANHAP